MPAVPYIIMGGAQIAGSAIAAHGNTSAANTQAASNDKALAQAKEIYEQQRQDEAPFRQLGVSSLGSLAYGMGLPDPNAVQKTNLPSSTISGVTFPGSPQVPSGTLSTLSNLSASNGPIAGKLSQQMLDKVNQAQSIVNQKYGGSGATTRMLAPNGLVYLVPNDKVADAQAAGGRPA